MEKVILPPSIPVTMTLAEAREEVHRHPEVETIRNKVLDILLDGNITPIQAQAALVSAWNLAINLGKISRTEAVHVD